MAALTSRRHAGRRSRRPRYTTIRDATPVSLDAPGEVCGRPRLNLPSPDPAITEPRTETGHRLIAEVVQTYLLTASGHFGGLASLYASGEVFFPPAALIRVIIENCAHAIWVLGDDPAEPSDSRLARAYLEELLSVEEAKKNAGRLGAKTDPIHVQADDDYRTLKRQILTRFPGTNANTLGNRTLNGQTLLNPEATVSWMYAFAERAVASSVGDRAALGIYGFLSTMTHPTLYPARQLREWTSDPAAGHPIAICDLIWTFWNAERRQP